MLNQCAQRAFIHSALAMESKTGQLENVVMLTVVKLDEQPELSPEGSLLLYGLCDSSGQ